MAPRRRGEHGEVVLGALSKLVVSLTAVAVLGFDAVSLVVTPFSAEDAAVEAARAAALTYRDSRNLQLAYETALASVTDDGGTIDPTSFLLGADGSITLTLQSEATTLLAHRVERLDDWRTVATTTSARPAA